MVLNYAVGRGAETETETNGVSQFGDRLTHPIWHWGVFVVSLLLVSACAHHQGCQRNATTIIEVAESVPSKDDLEHALHLLLDAHRCCDFGPELKNRITFGDRIMGEDYQLDRSMCLGELEITSYDYSVPQMVFIELKNTKKAANTSLDEGDYLLIAVVSGGRWLLYWPEPW